LAPRSPGPLIIFGLASPFDREFMFEVSTKRTLCGAILRRASPSWNIWFMIIDMVKQTYKSKERIL